MREVLIALKDCYQNTKGLKKVKILTKGKAYLVYHKLYNNIMVVNDTGHVTTFRMSLFTTQSVARDSKLKELGL